MGAEQAPQKTPEKKHTFLKIFLALCIVGFIGALVAGYGLYRWAVNDLPSFSKVADYRPAQVTTVLARDGSMIGQLYREKRYVISMSEMTPLLPKAFLAVEDSEFYEHPGVNITAIFRAFIANVKSGSHTQGGSTITQQIVKRLMLTPEKSYERKIKEAILAYRLEKQLSKDDILTIYLNQIFLGNNAYGVEAAARTYFGKHASELSIAECAMIAGLPQSPSANNPLRHPQAAQKHAQLHGDGDADVEGAFTGLCSDVFHDGEVYFELHDVFYLLGSLAAFVGGLHRDIGGVQLCGKRHGLGQVLLFFGQVADLPGSGVVLLGDIGYDFLLLGSQAVQRVNLVDVAYHDFAERGQFLLQTAYLGGIAALHGTEFFQ